MSDQGPTVFNGRYELLRHIARGGMADVYLARDELLDREVALKVLFPEFANDPNFVERFRREAQAAANLNDPHIVGIYDWGQERGTYYIVMEHVSGRSMSDVLRSTGPLQPDRAAEIAADVATALSTAHHAGLVHRDVKLGNILVSDDGDVKVADFGIATALAGGTDAGLTQHGSVMGTATYFSPEQAQGKPVDGRSDLYSLGVVLYEMLAGTPPFLADTPVAVAYKHVQERPESLADRGVSVATSLNAITMKLLAKNPANRYPTADDLGSDLRRYLAGAHQVPGAAAAGTAAAVAGAAVSGDSAAAADSGSGAEAASELSRSEMVDPTTVQPATPASVPAVVPAPAAAVQPGPVLDPNALAAHYTGGYYDDEPPPRDDWKRTVALLLGLGVLIFILGFLTIAFGRQLGVFGEDSGQTAEPEVEPVAVPNLVGQQVDAAETMLLDLELVPVRDPQRNDTTPVNEVFRQSPPAGEKREPGDEVTITISTGQADTVPRVVALTQEEAIAAVLEAGYEFTVVTEANVAVVGLVVAQDPPVGEELAVGETVTITVSAGPERIAIPDLEGKSLIDAVNRLQELGFRVEDEPVQEASETIPEDRVIRTEPAGETFADSGSLIQIVTSSGVPLVPVPSLIGLFYDTAESTLHSLGLVPVPQFQTVPFDDPQAGEVLAVSPAELEEIPVGSEVVVTVAQEGPEPASTTTTTTSTTTTQPDN